MEGVTVSMRRKLYIGSLYLHCANCRSFFSLPYYVSKPGMAKELEPIIQVENGMKGKAVLC